MNATAFSAGTPMRSWPDINLHRHIDRCARRSVQMRQRFLAVQRGNQPIAFARSHDVLIRYRCRRTPVSGLRIFARRSAIASSRLTSETASAPAASTVLAAGQQAVTIGVGLERGDKMDARTNAGADLRQCSARSHRGRSRTYWVLRKPHSRQLVGHGGDSVGSDAISAHRAAGSGLRATAGPRPALAALARRCAPGRGGLHIDRLRLDRHRYIHRRTPCVRVAHRYLLLAAESSSTAAGLPRVYGSP